MALPWWQHLYHHHHHHHDYKLSTMLSVKHGKEVCGWADPPVLMFRGWAPCQGTSDSTLRRSRARTRWRKRRQQQCANARRQHSVARPSLTCSSGQASVSRWCSTTITAKHSTEYAPSDWLRHHWHCLQVMAIQFTKNYKAALQCELLL